MGLFVTVDPQAAQERWQDKLMRKFKEEPYVPIGNVVLKLGVHATTNVVAAVRHCIDMSRLVHGVPQIRARWRPKGP